MPSVEHPILLGVLAIASWPAYRALALALFDDAQGFGEAVSYFFIPS